MKKTGFSSTRITGNFNTTLESITSLTLSNYGDSDITVIVNDVARKVPAYNPTIGVPFGSFNIPGDGTACDVRIVIEFPTGTGDCILDYRKLTGQETKC